mmetsp:Transcript_55632/g.63143  ORF Transcript_55632/g.63143 Transcript_55632/m.63143 type:complete len:425 (+) Transcript_55632:296-1570(+)
MPPVFDPSKSKVDGLAFLGLSLARNHSHSQSQQGQGQGHSDSVTHQTAFDLNEVLDRDYDHVFSTDDSGWLVGGGEPGAPHSYKLPAPDSAHVELMRIGTYRKEWGGMNVTDLVATLAAGTIRIPQIEVVPTAVVANHMEPPELELRFDLEDDNNNTMTDFDTFCTKPLPVNWALRFVHNQLFHTFVFPSRFCPGPFHSTMTRKAEFRSASHRQHYFAKCENVVQKWRAHGPRPLNTLPRPMVYRGESVEQKVGDGIPLDNNPRSGGVQESEENDEPKSKSKRVDDSNHQKSSTTTTDDGHYHSGIWLFTDRDTITHFFGPNFYPPYDTIEKRKIIYDVLQEEWDARSLSFVPYGQGTTMHTTPPYQQFGEHHHHHHHQESKNEPPTTTETTGTATPSTKKRQPSEDQNDDDKEMMKKRNRLNA